MRCPFQEGAFPFPVKYGYAFVGAPLDVAEGEGAAAGPVFALAPHQEFASLPKDAAIPLPRNLPPRRAILAANMETAINVIWDAGVGVGDKTLIVGAGVVGLLIGYLAQRIPGVAVAIADRNPNRRPLAEALGLAFCAPPDGPEDVDVAINASASGAGLAYALEKAGAEARIVEASWHGDADVSLPLGRAFHARRLSIVSSQVGAVPPARAPRWSHRRRLALALDLLAEAPALDALITHELALADAPEALPTLLEADADALCIAIRYPA